MDVTKSRTRRTTRATRAKTNRNVREASEIYVTPPTLATEQATPPGEHFSEFSHSRAWKYHSYPTNQCTRCTVYAHRCICLLSASWIRRCCCVFCRLFSIWVWVTATSAIVLACDGCKIRPVQYWRLSKIVTEGTYVHRHMCIEVY